MDRYLEHDIPGHDQRALAGLLRPACSAPSMDCQRNSTDAGWRRSSPPRGSALARTAFSFETAPSRCASSSAEEQRFPKPPEAGSNPVWQHRFQADLA